jgi:hypothetical protein
MSELAICRQSRSIPNEKRVLIALIRATANRYWQRSVSQGRYIIQSLSFSAVDHPSHTDSALAPLKFFTPKKAKTQAPINRGGRNGSKS